MDEDIIHGFVPFKPKTNDITVDENMLQTLNALCDTFLPALNDKEIKIITSLHARSETHAQHIREYCKLKPSDTNVVTKLLELMNDPYRIPRRNANDFCLSLSLLSSSWGMMILTGSMTPFKDLSMKQKEQIFIDLSKSNFAMKRLLVSSIKSLVCLIFHAALSDITSLEHDTLHQNSTSSHSTDSHLNVDTFDNFGGGVGGGVGVGGGKMWNPSWNAMLYPGPDPNRNINPMNSNTTVSLPQSKSPYNVYSSTSDDSTPTPTPTLSSLSPLPLHLFSQQSSSSDSTPSWHLSQPHSTLQLLLTPLYKFKSPHTISPSNSSSPSPITLHVDAVVIGSGIGGGVAALELARMGLKVMVIEQGGYHPSHTLSLLEEEAFAQLYENGGFLTNTDGSMSILAGRTLGGGSYVNWSCCIDTPQKVREEWAKMGLYQLNTPLFTACVEYAKHRMQVHTQSPDSHNGPNSVVLSGAEASGLSVALTGQNGREKHKCGWCCFGCPNGDKQGSVYSCLEHGVKTYNNILLLSNTKVHKVNYSRIAHEYVAPSSSISVDSVSLDLTSSKYLSPVKTNPSVTGVTAYTRVPTKTGDQEGVKSLPVSVVAPIVICSAGSLHTPGVLQRSKLRNTNIGKHLRLHPVSAIVGLYENNTTYQFNNKYNGGVGVGDVNKKTNVNGSVVNTPTTTTLSSSGAEALFNSISADLHNDNSIRDISILHQHQHQHQNEEPSSLPPSFEDVSCFEGTPMTTVCTEAADLHGDGYGVRIETPSVHTGFAAFSLRWIIPKGYFSGRPRSNPDLSGDAAVDALIKQLYNTSVSSEEFDLSSLSHSQLALLHAYLRNGARFKGNLTSFRRVVPLIALVRDSGEGSVSYDENECVQVNYSLNQKDRKSLIEGIKTGVKLLVASKCDQILVPHVDIPIYRPNHNLGLADPTLTAFLKEIERAGVVEHVMLMMSAHQMGTARLATSVMEGPCKPSGEVTEVNNLYVCDNSLFPTSSGVNPMVTGMALSRYVMSHVENRVNSMKLFDKKRRESKTNPSHDDSSQSLNSNIHAKL